MSIGHSLIFEIFELIFIQLAVPHVELVSETWDILHQFSFKENVFWRYVKV